MKAYDGSGGTAPCILKVSGQIHALATLSTKKSPWYPLNRGTPESVWKFWKRKKKPLLSARIETMIPLSSIKLHEIV
jgi:hypothetical protein